MSEGDGEMMERMKLMMKESEVCYSVFQVEVQQCASG